MTDTPSVSVVIPVYRDVDALRRLMPLLDTADAQGPARIKERIVVVADTDRGAIEEAVGGRAMILESAAGRGLQLNTGARAATGDVLWFLHADATPPGKATEAILQHMSEGHDGGWFRFRFEGVRNRGARPLAALINWRARRGVAYGDQALFFRRSAFFEWGEFDEVPLFEEVRLVRTAKARGRFAELDWEVGVDPRRWQETGWVRRTLMNRALALGHAAGIDSNRLARWYRRR